MITDASLQVADNLTVAGDPTYTSSIDLDISPDIGSGETIYAVINVHTYTNSSSSGTTINVVTSPNVNLTSSRKIGSVLVLPQQLLDRSAGDAQPVIIKINPSNEETSELVSGVGERYLGVQFDHIGTPDTMTASVYFTVDSQSSPAHSHHATGLEVL